MDRIDTRHVPFHIRDELEIKKMLDQDLIEPVTGPTPWASPIVPVPKRNQSNEIRICTDARYANKAIMRERHITPTIDDLILKLNGATVISNFDLKCGYNQLVIHPDCRFITTFCTHMGLFRYKRLNFGVNTAAEIFQKTIESVLSGIEDAVNKSDDIIVFVSNQKEHDSRLNSVLSILEKFGLTLNPDKCTFSANKLDFFGLNFSGNGVSIQESKVDALFKAKAPKNVNELRSLLGLANYCNRFIKDLASIVNPLRQLTKKNVK